jgi:predicted RNase H-like HicB family nuclease
MRSEIVFDVKQEEDGGYSAQAVGESIFTQGDTWEELREMARDAVKCHFGEAEAPATIRLHLLHDEVFAAA